MRCRELVRLTEVMVEKTDRVELTVDPESLGWKLTIDNLKITGFTDKQLHSIVKRYMDKREPD